jgi:hypothetical protein
MQEFQGAPIPLHERAADNLRFIRETMERSGSFTAVPGWGGIAMGVSAAIAALLAHGVRDQGAAAWLSVWLICLAIALVLGTAGVIFKARRSRIPLFHGPGRKFALSMLPPLVVGGLLTIALTRWNLVLALPAVWMLSYGTAVTSGGAFSVRIIPLLGALFIAAGAVTLFLPVGLGDLMMALSFGGLHIAFGAVVARKYGG